MKLALIAGTGALPFVLFQHLGKLGSAPIVCALQGFEPEISPNITFRIEHLGSFLKALQADGVSHICMAGAVRRPEIDPAEIDVETAPLVPVLQQAMSQGDDGALRGIMSLMKDMGFTVIGAAELMPELLPPSGVLTKTWPEDTHKEDAKLGDATLGEMGASDTGQACIIKAGVIIAREGPEGTDAMMIQEHKSKTRLAILFKAPKPGQDRRADLPVIGPMTARNAVDAKLAGIVIEEGGVMVLDLPYVRRILDAAGLFLWVRKWD